MTLVMLQPPIPSPLLPVQPVRPPLLQANSCLFGNNSVGTGPPPRLRPRPQRQQCCYYRRDVPYNHDP